MSIISTARDLLKKVKSGYAGYVSSPFVQRYDKAVNQPIYNATNALWNKGANIPRFQFSRELIGNAIPQSRTPAGQMIANFALGIPESMVNIPRNLVVGQSRLQKENQDMIRRTMTGQKIAPNWQNIATGVAPLAEAGLDIASFGMAKSIAKAGGKEVLRRGVGQAIKKGAISGAFYGGTGGLTYGVGNQYGKKFNTGEVIQATLAGTALGGIVGGTVSGIGAYKELVNYKKDVVQQLRDAKGQWTAGDVPVKPKGMPDPQWEFQLDFNKKWNRNPYEPVFSSDLKQAIKIEAEQRAPALQVRDINKDKIRGTLPKPLSVPKVNTDIAPPKVRGQSKLAKIELSDQPTRVIVSQKDGVQLESTSPNQIDLETKLAGVSSTDILPQKGKLNVKNLNLDESGQKAVRAADTTPATVIGNKDVIETSKLTTGSNRPITDAEMQILMAKRLNSRQTVVTLTKEFEALKKSGADEATLISKFNEIADQSIIAKQENTLAGRQLQAASILADELATPQQKILALLDNAGISKDKYSKEAVKIDWNNSKQVVEFYRKFVPPKLGEILTEFRYTNMLSSPLTHIVNTATNLFQTGVITPIEKTISGTLDWAKSTITGSERKYYISDGIKYTKGFYSSLPKAWAKFRNVVTGKEVAIKPDMERIPVSTGGIYKAYTTPLKALEAADQFFMELVKGGESASLQNRGLSAAAIAAKAENSARYRLFRQQFDPQGKTGQGYLLQVWDKYNSVVQQLRRFPGGRWIVPFLQTPTNILKQGVEYSPLGILTVPGSKNAIEQLSKTIIGTTVFAGAYGLLNSMEFTWEVPSGQKERDLFYAANMQPYSIKVGNQWVSYSKLGPLSYPIAMAAALRYAEKYDLPTDKESAISTAVGGMLKFFSDQSYVRQLGDFMDSLQTGKGIVGGLKAEVSNSVSQLIPYKSFLGWLSRMIDPVNRKSTGVVSSITSQLPFLSKTVDPYYNPVTKQPSERSNRFLNSFSPVRITEGSTSIENMYKYTASAKRTYSNLMALPAEERGTMYLNIKRSNPTLIREVDKIGRDVALNITGEDKAMLNLSVGDGERAFTIAQQFRQLKTTEEKVALYKKYKLAGIITPEVEKQLRTLLSK